MTEVDQRQSARIFIGLAILLLGVALLVRRADIWGLHIDLRLWPFFLIFLGLVKMTVPGGHRSRRGGFWLLAVGFWGLISEAQLFGLDYSTSWPLLIIALGINIVWRSIEPPSRRHLQGQ